MNRKHVLTLLLALVLVLALAGSTAVADSSAWSGEAYRLSSSTWHARGASAGAGYSLRPAGETLSSGTPCCCALAPCVMLLGR